MEISFMMDDCLVNSNGLETAKQLWQSGQRVDAIAFLEKIVESRETPNDNHYALLADFYSRLNSRTKALENLSLCQSRILSMNEVIQFRLKRMNGELTNEELNQTRELLETTNSLTQRELADFHFEIGRYFEVQQHSSLSIFHYIKAQINYNSIDEDYLAEVCEYNICTQEYNSGHTKPSISRIEELRKRLEQGHFEYLKKASGLFLAIHHLKTENRSQALEYLKDICPNNKKPRLYDTLDLIIFEHTLQELLYSEKLIDFEKLLLSLVTPEQVKLNSENNRYQYFVTLGKILECFSQNRAETELKRIYNRVELNSTLFTKLEIVTFLLNRIMGNKFKLISILTKDISAKKIHLPPINLVDLYYLRAIHFLRLDEFSHAKEEILKAYDFAKRANLSSWTQKLSELLIEYEIFCFSSHITLPRNQLTEKMLVLRDLHGLLKDPQIRRKNQMIKRHRSKKLLFENFYEILNTGNYIPKDVPVEWHSFLNNFHSSFNGSTSYRSLNQEITTVKQSPSFIISDLENAITNCTGERLLRLSGIPGKILKLLVQNYSEVSKELIVEKVWQEDYNPLIHDQRIYASIKQVKKSTGLNITNGRQGYLLNDPRVIKIISPSLMSKVTTKRQNQIIELIKSRFQISKKAICEDLEISATSAKNDLRALIGLQKITRIGSGPNTHYVLS